MMSPTRPPSNSRGLYRVGEIVIDADRATGAKARVEFGGALCRLLADPLLSDLTAGPAFVEKVLVPARDRFITAAPQIDAKIG